MNVKWIKTIRVPLPSPWKEADVPEGYAVAEGCIAVKDRVERFFPDGSIRLGEHKDLVLLAIPASWIHAWLSPLKSQDLGNPVLTIPPDFSSSVSPAWWHRVRGKNVILKGEDVDSLWVKDQRGVWCINYPKAWALFELLYPTSSLLEQIAKQWKSGKLVTGDLVPEPGPWPPVSWIESEIVQEALAHNDGGAPPAQTEGTCPSCGASGYLIVQETISERKVEAPCSHLKGAVEILARGPLVFAWGEKPGWTILPAGLVGPMGYRFGSPAPLALLWKSDAWGIGEVWVGLALSDAEARSLARHWRLPRDPEQSFFEFLTDRMFIGYERGGAIIFSPSKIRTGYGTPELEPLR